MKKLISLKIFFLLFCSFTVAQQSKGIFGEPLTCVLAKVEKVFDVTFRYDNNVVKGLKVYSPKGITSDFKQTVNDILKPLGLVYHKTANGSYRISEFEVNHKRTVAEGEKQLESLLSLYKNADEFNRRKTELRKCMLEALGINPDLKGGPLHSIIRSKKIMNGYTVQNIAFESFPGYYVTVLYMSQQKAKGLSLSFFVRMDIFIMKQTVL